MCVDNLAAKKWERFLATKFEPKSNENLSKCVRGSVSECLSMRELNTPLSASIWREERACTRGVAGHNGQVTVWKGGAQEQLPLCNRPVGSPGPWVGHLVPSFGQASLQWSKTLKMWCTAKVCSKRCSNYFPKNFETQKIFLIFL